MCINSWEVFLVVIKKKKTTTIFPLLHPLYECTVRKGNVNFGIKGKSTRITVCDNHFKANKWSDEIGGFQQANLDSLAREGL